MNNDTSSPGSADEAVTLYLAAQKAVAEDEKLCGAIANYEEKARALTELLSTGDSSEYNPDAALDFAKQISVLSDYLHENEKLNRLKAASEKLRQRAKALNNSAGSGEELSFSISCDGNCSHCLSKCDSADINFKKE